MNVEVSTEHDMVQRVLRLGDRAIRTMMTPRTEICWLDLDDSLEDNLAEVRESNHSRFPVAQGSLDNCIGIVKVRSLLTAHMGREPIDLPALEDEDEPSFVTRQVRMSITHWLAS